MDKSYQTVAEMLHDTVGSPLAERYEQHVADHAVSKSLLQVRLKADTTQSALAGRLGWRQNRVSRLEHAPNARIRLGDLVDYASALGLNVELRLAPRTTAVERTKCLAVEIKQELEHLATLAQKDPKIHDGVSRFFSEYLANTIRFFAQSLESLAKGESSDPKQMVAVAEKVLGGAIDLLLRSEELLPGPPAAGQPSLRVCSAISIEEGAMAAEAQPNEGGTPHHLSRPQAATGSRRCCRLGS
ncbi:MAG: helix-turn-helix transcriptional regulator [Candidatus Latescibacterota bacterium]